MIGVVVMAYGTPAAPDDVEAYYTHVRRGRPPTPEQLADLVRRYDAIGGLSPLAANSAAQQAAIAAALGDGYVVVGGNKHAAPFIEDAVGALVDQGVESIAGVVMAPHYSAASVGEYHARAREAAGSTPFVGVDRWFDLDEFIRFEANSLRNRLVESPERVKVLFTAHSLPERSLVGDPYPNQLFSGAGAIATAAGLRPWGDWAIAWQSAGRTPEPWRGPDILSVIADLAATGKADGVVIVPHGFTSEHLEVLYDVDIEAAGAAQAAGLTLSRTDVVGADPSVMGALAGRIAASVS
jgi:ferrochelatase